MFTYGLLTDGLDHYDHIIIDAATHAPRLEHPRRPTIYITLPCYLSLRRAIATPRPSHVIYIHEDNRSLDARDIETVLGIPVTATIRHDH